jgi:hypothetical protein
VRARPALAAFADVRADGPLKTRLFHDCIACIVEGRTSVLQSRGMPQAFSRV